MKEKKDTTSINAEKAFEKIQHPFRMITLNKLATEGKFINILKTLYRKPTPNIILNGERRSLFRLETKHGCPLCHFYST